MQDLKALLPAEIAKEITLLDLKPYRARQIFQWIHQRFARNFEAMNNLAKAERELLKQHFFISDLKLEKVRISKDKTKKYLLRLTDDHFIEAALLLDEDRKTLCVSTQVGCPLNCAFCASGKLGFIRNLTAAEIISQIEFIYKEEGGLNNLVFMGMGEPFLNYENTLRAIRIINDREGLNIGARKISVSTSGIPDKIREFAEENLQVRLALSLNAADNQLRSYLMPLNRKYSLPQVLLAIDEYIKKTGRRVSFEYVLIKNINDRDIDLVRLIGICQKRDVQVNLIPLNPHPGSVYQSSEKAGFFKKELQAAGINCGIRFRRGLDIEAACGQLVFLKSSAK